jgi:two-component system cell cycle response regulator
MPVMDGFEMCRIIKSQDELKQIPVVLLTTQSRPQDVLRGLESGADSYVTKPYDESTLLSTIERTLSVLTVQVPEELMNTARSHWKPGLLRPAAVK